MRLVLGRFAVVHDLGVELDVLGPRLAEAALGQRLGVLVVGVAGLQAAAAQGVEQGPFGRGLDVGVQVDALHEQGPVFFEGAEVDAGGSLLALDVLTGGFGQVTRHHFVGVWAAWIDLAVEQASRCFKVAVAGQREFVGFSVALDVAPLPNVKCTQSVALQF